MRHRYRLQRKEPHVIYDTVGKPLPVHTYQWTDIALSDDIDSLIEYLGGLLPKDYRIIDTEDGGKVVKTGGW